jgi:hypothetical protein
MKFYPIRVSKINSALTMLNMSKVEAGRFVYGTKRLGWVFLGVGWMVCIFLVWGCWLRMGRKQPEQAPFK